MVVKKEKDELKILKERINLLEVNWCDERRIISKKFSALTWWTFGLFFISIILILTIFFWSYIANNTVIALIAKLVAGGS